MTPRCCDSQGPTILVRDVNHRELVIHAACQSRWPELVPVPTLPEWRRRALEGRGTVRVEYPGRAA